MAEKRFIRAARCCQDRGQETRGRPLVKTPDSLNLVQRRLTVTRKTKSAQGDAIDTRVPASGLGES